MVSAMRAFAYLFCVFQTSVLAQFNLTILHINDHHSHLSGRSQDLTITGVSQEVTLKVSGFPRLVTAMAARESAAEAAGHGVLKLHAGDAITGTSFYSIFTGEADAALMQHACFDAFALGNHEFDDGDANLATFLTNLRSSATCPSTQVLAANVEPAANSPLQGMLNRSAIFDLMGEHVGVVGIDIRQKTMRSSSPSAGTILTDEKTTAQSEIDMLVSNGVNKIVLLTHIGYTNDQNWMSTLTGVDVVIGGDSHSLLGGAEYSVLGTTKGAYPTETMNADGKKMCIAQAWEYTKLLGELAVEFDSNGDVVSCSGKPKVPYEPDSYVYEDGGAAVSTADKTLINDYLMADDMWLPAATDTQAEATFQTYQDQVSTLQNTKIADVPTPLCRDRIPGQAHGGCTAQQSLPNGGPACQVAVQAFLSRTQTAQLAIQNAGGCREDIPPGLVGSEFTYDDAYTVLAFRNTYVTFEMTGAKIKEVLESALTYALADDGSTGAYPYAAGLRFDVSLNETAGNRLSNLEVNPRLANAVWQPLVDTTTYIVVTHSFLAGGRDGYDAFAEAGVASTMRNTFMEYAQGLIDYAKALGTLVAPPIGHFSTQGFIDVNGVDHSRRDPDAVPPSDNTTTSTTMVNDVANSASLVSCTRLIFAVVVALVIYQG